MVLSVIGSGSDGNCYVLSGSNGILVLEAGESLQKLKKAVKWQLNRIVACLISHEHNDHAGYLSKYKAACIPTMALPCVYQKQGIKGRGFCTEVEPLKRYRVGGFMVTTIPLDHDVPCIGYIIEHAELGRLAFITDTMMLRYKLPPCDHIIIEANYSDEILTDNIARGIEPRGKRERLMTTHMELGTTIHAIQANDTERLKTVFLAHLSASNASEVDFLTSVQKTTTAAVYVAKSGLTVDISKTVY